MVIIGAGPGGYVAAIKAAQLGLNVACVEGRGSLGGTCLNVGCIPSKALLQSSHQFSEAKSDFAKHGIVFDNLRLDLPAMLKQKDRAVSNLTKGIEFLFKKNKVEWLKGWGSIPAVGQVSVKKDDGSTETVNTKNIIIASGSEVTPLKGVERDGELIVDSDGAIDFKKVPEHLVVIGGGIIGLELGSVWCRLGSKVTVIEFLDVIATPLDNEIRRTFQRLIEKQGLKFLLGQKVNSATKKDGKVTLNYEPSKGGESKDIEADAVLLATGRRPIIDNLNLDGLGVKTERGRILVDHNFKTNVDGVYAIGDCIPGPMLAHKAEDDGIAAVEGLVGRKPHVNYDTVPSIMYTFPEVAQVGKTEEQLKQAGVDYKVGKFPFAANSRAKAVEIPDGMVKFLADKKTDKILGVHICGPSAGELI